jgi:hypothetical protein
MRDNPQGSDADRFPNQSCLYAIFQHVIVVKAYGCDLTMCNHAPVL